jgi:hypothetical protein
MSIVKWSPPTPGLVDYIRVVGPYKGFRLWLHDTLKRFSHDT